MSDEERDLANLRDFLMRASHERLREVLRALGGELLARGLPGGIGCFELARLLGRCASRSRAEAYLGPV